MREFLILRTEIILHCKWASSKHLKLHFSSLITGIDKEDEEEGEEETTTNFLPLNDNYSVLQIFNINIEIWNKKQKLLPAVAVAAAPPIKLAHQTRIGKRKTKLFFARNCNKNDRKKGKRNKTFLPGSKQKRISTNSPLFV